MSFGHEKLDVYRISIEYVSWVYTHCDKLSGTQRHARDQLLRASQSIPLNIAEGNGKSTLVRIDCDADPDPDPEKTGISMNHSITPLVPHTVVETETLQTLKNPVSISLMN